MPEIASRVRPLREALEMGRAEFCEAVGVKKTTIINIEKGIQGVTEVFIVATCKKWPQFAYWFVTGKTDEKHGHINPDMYSIHSKNFEHVEDQPMSYAVHEPRTEYKTKPKQKD